MRQSTAYSAEPPPTLFGRICDADHLGAAFERVRANGGGPGGDGQTAEAFARGLELRLARLSADLLHGTYRPGPLRHVSIPKKSGGLRTLAIPTITDRVVQTSTAAALQPILEPEFEDASFAYRPGRSVQQAIARVLALGRAGYRFAVDADIERYFDNVPHAPLLERLSGLVHDPRAVELCALWLEEAGPGGRGLPQGSPISPLLANLYLDSVDEAITAADDSVRLVRYADDFIVLCRSAAEARGMLERVGAILSAHGLMLNPEKTRLVSFAEGFGFLGQTIADSDIRQPPERLAAAAEAGRAPAELRPEPVRLIKAPPPADEDPSSDKYAPIVRPLYILSPGHRLVLRNEAFSVEADGTEKLALPPRAVDRIELGPEVEASTPALRQALHHGIPISFVDGHGGAFGHGLARFDRHAARHLAQARVMLEPAARIDLARRIVSGRIANQQRLLKRLNRTRKLERVTAAAAALLREGRKLSLAKTADEAMGYEGAAAQIYWPAFGKLLLHGFTFAKRLRHPAPDPINALLDWLSSLLTRDVLTLVLRHGLHPGFGALHSPEDGADAAVYDLVEEFRAPIAEALVISLINNRFIGPKDFYEVEGMGLRVGQEARSEIVRAYEKWLDRPVMSPRHQTQTTWRGIIDEQVEAYVRHIEGLEPYQPFRLDF